MRMQESAAVAVPGPLPGHPLAKRTCDASCSRRVVIAPTFNESFVSPCITEAILLHNDFVECSAISERVRRSCRLRTEAGKGSGASSFLSKQAAQLMILAGSSAQPCPLRRVLVQVMS